MRSPVQLLLDHLPADASASPTAAAASPTAAAARDWLQRLSPLPARHKVLFGGLSDAADTAHGARQGIALAYDGMEIDL